MFEGAEKRLQKAIEAKNKVEATTELKEMITESTNCFDLETVLDKTLKCFKNDNIEKPQAKEIGQRVCDAIAAKAVDFKMVQHHFDDLLKILKNFQPIFDADYTPEIKKVTDIEKVIVKTIETKNHNLTKPHLETWKKVFNLEW